MNYRLTFVLLSISLRVLQYVDILDQRFRRNPVLKGVYVHPNTRKCFFMLSWGKSNPLSLARFIMIKHDFQ